MRSTISAVLAALSFILVPMFHSRASATERPAKTPVSAESWVTEGARDFHEVLLKCPERLWPDMDWSKTQFLFADPQTRRAWLIGAGSREAELLAATEVPEVAYRSIYAFVVFRGLKTVTISLDYPAFGADVTPFDLAVHEMFHYVGQENWARSRGTRGTLVPLDFEPRYLRAEMMKALRASYLDQQNLSAAAGWFEQWSSRFSHEVKATTDGYEGSANYVETLARILRKKSCAATDAEIQKTIADALNEFHSFPGISLDSEGYGMGALAGFIMDKLGMSWKGGVALGSSPVTQLLANKATGVPAGDPALKTEYEKKYAEINASIDVWRLPFEEMWQSPDYVRVAVPENWGGGSFSPKGFYIPRADQKALYTPFNGEHRFDVASGEWIVAADNAVGYSHQENQECANTTWYFLVPRSAIAESDGAFRAVSGEITFDIGGAYQTGKDGFTYLCSSTK